MSSSRWGRSLAASGACCASCSSAAAANRSGPPGPDERGIGGEGTGLNAIPVTLWLLSSRGFLPTLGTSHFEVRTDDTHHVVGPFHHVLVREVHHLPSLEPQPCRPFRPPLALASR